MALIHQAVLLSVMFCIRLPGRVYHRKYTFGSRNPFNVVRATFDAIDRLMTKGQVEKLRGVDIEGDSEPEEPVTAEATELDQLIEGAAAEEVEDR